MLLSIDVTENDTLVENYILYVDGTLIKKDVDNNSEEKNEISEDDALKIYEYAFGTYRDITEADLSDDKDSARNIKVSLYYYVTGKDGDKKQYEQKAYHIDEHYEQLQPILEMIELY